MGLEKWHEVGKKLEGFLRCESFPIAYKLIKDEKEIPEKTWRPLQDYKCKLLICQCLSLTKTTGRTHALTFDDHYCIEGAVAHGWLEKPPYMKDGSLLYPTLVPSQEVGRRCEENKPFIDSKKGYKGVVMSPLGWTKIEPDLILLSLNPARVNRVMEAICDQTGETIVAEHSGRGGLCCWGIAPAMNGGRPTYVIPTFGEFRFTCDSDDDMWFVIPVNYVKPLIEGLEHTHKAGWRFPIPRFVEHEPNWPVGYGYKTYEEYLRKNEKSKD
jgi:uncharacterized protein (DUF169 family)